VHWTCATPRPEGSERIPFIDEAEWEEHVAAAESLLHVTGSAFGEAPQAQAILRRVQEEFAADGLRVRPLPVAADPRPDGTLRWGGTDVVFGPLVEGAYGDRFELRAETLAIRLQRSDGRVVGALVRNLRTGVEENVQADAVVVAADAFHTPQLLWASDIRPEALGRYLTEHPLLFGIVAVRDGVLPPPVKDDRLATDPIRGVVSVVFSDDGHPFHAQLMYSPVCPVPLPEKSPNRDNPAGYAMVGYGLRKFPRPEDRVTFDEATPDENGLPGIVVAYDLTDLERAEVELAKKFQARAAGALGEFVENMPRLMPSGTSLHFMGTFRMGPADDGTSVCDSFSRVWGIPGLVLAGNGLIPTPNACNPTLTSVALAIRGARALASDLRLRGATAA
jgi:choline dehydrogenase-like flavoprotein